MPRIKTVPPSPSPANLAAKKMPAASLIWRDKSFGYTCRTPTRGGGRGEGEGGLEGNKYEDNEEIVEKFEINIHLNIQ